MRNARMLAATAVAATLLAAACARRGGETTRSDKGWDVMKNGKAVEWIDDKPGVLASLGAPPPPGSGAKPVTHPFLTAKSNDFMEEGALNELLSKATGFDDYVRLLKQNGYEVRPAAQAR